MKQGRYAREASDPKLEMTPMIDVVFQLLIFFVVTFEFVDLLSRLEVSRPAPVERPDRIEVDIPLLTIRVYDQGFTLQGQRVTLQEIERQLVKLGRFSPNVSVVIQCTANSPHAFLVELLDVCAAAKLGRLSLFSL